MNPAVEYRSNMASEAEIAEHLSRCDADFIPSLSARVEINSYAKKIASKGTRFEAWSGGTLIGLVATYCNDRETRIAYITSVSVTHEWFGQGIAAQLLTHCIDHAKTMGMQQISLDVSPANLPAIKLYEKAGFIAKKTNTPFISMNLYLDSEQAYEQYARL